MDDYKIYPLATTMPDWRIYNKVCEEILGEQPTKSLDAAGIEINRPEAYLCTLGDLSPLDNLRSYNITHEHVHLTLVAALPKSIMFALVSTSIKMFYKQIPDEHDKVLVFMSGSINDWRNTVITNSTNKKLRRFYNQLYELLCRIGYREIFYNYSRSEQPDGTYILTLT